MVYLFLKKGGHSVNALIVVYIKMMTEHNQSHQLCNAFCDFSALRTAVGRGLEATFLLSDWSARASNKSRFFFQGPVPVCAGAGTANPDGGGGGVCGDMCVKKRSYVM